MQMQREIKFMGKRVDNGEWVYGLPVNYCNKTYILVLTDFEEERVYEQYPHKEMWSYEVILETIGQFTGLHDKNGKEIYEGDILKVETGWYKSRKQNIDAKFDNNTKGITYWTVEHKIFPNQVGFMIYGIDRRFHKLFTPNMVFNNKAEVIGNIYENSELLKEASYEA